MKRIYWGIAVNVVGAAGLLCLVIAGFLVAKALGYAVLGIILLLVLNSAVKTAKGWEKEQKEEAEEATKRKDLGLN